MVELTSPLLEDPELLNDYIKGLKIDSSEVQTILALPQDIIESISHLDIESIIVTTNEEKDERGSHT